MISTRALMLVSATVSAELRREVAQGGRPRPEFLELEARGVELLDWSRLPGSPGRRSARAALLQVAAALPRLRRMDAVFSDSEQVGIPLALAMLATGARTRHLMLGHHLSNGRKPALLRRLRPQRRVDRILVHSPRQLELAAGELGIPVARLTFDPYFVDTDFWSPRPGIREEPLIVSAGLEHRDYATLAAAWEGRPEPVFVAAGSVHSPGAAARLPVRWPDGFRVEGVAPARLRDLYARASVVVVPVVETDFQAGITVVLEAMAMGKAVVATAAAGWAGAITHGADGLLVPPGDVVALRGAMALLFDDPRLRARLGRVARQTAVTRFGLPAYADRLQGHLEDLGGTLRAAA